ncbi:MAG TPA: bis-aminopropyl spermidine synthase family protein [Symbiobacteriaceae bacterium]
MASTGIAVEAHRTQVLLLRTLYFGPRSFWELLRAGRAHTHQVLEALQGLLSSELVTYDGSNFVITPAGRRQVEELGLDRVADTHCEICAGRGHVLRPPFDHVLAEFREIAALRPRATSDFDQGYVTPEVTVLRLALMAQHGDLAGRDLLLLGDDDLTGIAAALSGLPRRICVLDVDERIVQFIREVARDRGWQNLQAEVYDVRTALPSHLRGQFDVFFTDPVETLKGIFLFLSRCTEALRGPGAAGYFGLSYLEASWRKWRQIQQGLLQMGYAITEMRSAWQDYLLEDIVARGYPVAQMAPVPVQEPDVAFYTSTVYRLQLVEAPQPIYSGPVELGRELYYDEEACVTLPE